MRPEKISSGIGEINEYIRQLLAKIQESLKSRPEDVLKSCSSYKQGPRAEPSR